MGFFRFFLAMSVVAFHLTAQLPSIGMLAVNGFYTVSGFLITLILRETYSTDSKAFFINRVLRLYPAYLTCVVTALALHALAPQSRMFHQSWANAMQPGDIWGNALMVPWAFLSDDSLPPNVLNLRFLWVEKARYRLVPSSWSVAVEIVCYSLLWLAVARNMRAAALTFALALGWHGYAFVSGAPDVDRYFPVPAAILPFSLGALAYFIRAQLPAAMHARTRGNRFIGVWIVVVLTVFILNWATDFPGTVSTRSYFLNYAIGFLAVLSIGAERPAGRLAVWDRLLGDLSYPIFLSHYIIGAAVYIWLSPAAPIRGWAVFYQSVPAILAFSAIVVFVVERPIAAVRNHVRPHAA